MKKQYLSIIGISFVFVVVLFSCKSQNLTQVASKTESSRIEGLIDKMSLEEKIGQMNQYTGFFDVTGPAPAAGENKTKYEHIRKGLVGSMLNVKGAEDVRAMQKLAVENSPNGIPLIFGYDVIHGHKTIAPIPLAEAASWDLEEIKKSARVAAIEASAEGLNWTFAPMVDISRDARWGRVMEGAGEDPYLGSKIAIARVKGFQGDDLSASNTIAACTKHFAAYGFAESGKDYNTADIGLSTLYNVVLPPFKATVDANVQTFMNSFNELNGIPATGDKYLQRDVLKDEWNFEGFIVSDWGSIGEMMAHGYAADGMHASSLAANAGSDMDMESHLYIKHLKALVEKGEVKMSTINDAVRRILKVKENLGLFDDPYKYCNTEVEKKMIYHPDHLEAALDMARKSIVLLKNEKGTLPLKKAAKNIALIGHLAADKNSPLGNWRLSAKDHSAISVKEALESRFGKDIKYQRGVKLFDGQEHFVHELKINKEDRSGIDEAVALAKTSEVVIMVLGEHGLQSGEGRSRANIGLPGLQQEMLEEVYKVNQNIILVLMNGRPLAIPWAEKNIPSILETWHLGTQSGEAIVDVLVGDYNPSGKLPMTFPRDVSQVPIYYNHKMTGRPGPKDLVFWSHYIDHTNDPLFPFGHGLSYTDFEYSDLSVTMSPTERKVSVSVSLSNSGDRDGAEVVQLYLRDKVASVTRPVKELKSFEKVFLKSGETRKIVFELTEAELGFYNNQGKYIVESGSFDLLVGGSSAEGLTSSFNLK